jgi:hypothetical protein
MTGLTQHLCGPPAIDGVNTEPDPITTNFAATLMVTNVVF